MLVLINFYRTLMHYPRITERSVFSGVFRVLGIPIINMSAHADNHQDRKPENIP